MNLFGIWRQNEYVLAYKANGNTGANEKVLAGQNFKPIGIPKDLANKGFVNWNTLASGKGKTYEGGVKARTPLTQHTLYAQRDNLLAFYNSLDEEERYYFFYPAGIFPAPMYPYQESPKIAYLNNVDKLKIIDISRKHYKNQGDNRQVFKDDLKAKYNISVDIKMAGMYIAEYEMAKKGYYTEEFSRVAAETYFSTIRTIAALGALEIASGSLALKTYCFAAGTQVSTEKGKVAIEDVRVGDKVWAENPESGERALKTVVRTFLNKTSELVRVYAGGEEIVATPNHPFYVNGKGWTNAIDLGARDILVTVNGEYKVVERIQPELLERPISVYNFEVEDFHTYFVGESSILVHNANCGDTPKNIYTSIKKAPGYDSNFAKAQNGLTTRAVNNKELLSELNKFGSGWKKVFQNGWIKGEPVSLHYFKSNSGQIFDFWIKKGWS